MLDRLGVIHAEIQDPQNRVINLAKGGAVPTRTDIAIPQEIQDATIQQSEYANSVPITDAAKYAEVGAEISRRWEEEIIPLMSQ